MTKLATGTAMNITANRRTLAVAPAAISSTAEPERHRRHREGPVDSVHRGEGGGEDTELHQRMKPVEKGVGDRGRG